MVVQNRLLYNHEGTCSSSERIRRIVVSQTPRRTQITARLQTDRDAIAAFFRVSIRALPAEQLPTTIRQSQYGTKVCAIIDSTRRGQ